MPIDAVNDETAQAEWILRNLPDVYTKIQQNNRRAKGPKVTFLYWYELGIKTPRTKTGALPWSIIDFIKQVIEKVIDLTKSPAYMVEMVSAILVMEKHFGIFYEDGTPKPGFKALCHLPKSVTAGDMTLFTGDRVVLQDMDGQAYFRIAYGAPDGNWVEHYAPIAGRAEDECGTFTVTVIGENEIALRADNRNYLGCCTRYSDDGGNARLRRTDSCRNWPDLLV